MRMKNVLKKYLQGLAVVVVDVVVGLGVLVGAGV